MAHSHTGAHWFHEATTRRSRRTVAGVMARGNVDLRRAGSGVPGLGLSSRDPLADPAYPLAEALGAFGYFFLVNGLVFGLSRLVIWVRARHESGE